MIAQPKTNATSTERESMGNALKWFCGFARRYPSFVLIAVGAWVVFLPFAIEEYLENASQSGARGPIDSILYLFAAWSGTQFIAIATFVPD